MVVRIFGVTPSNFGYILQIAPLKAALNWSQCTFPLNQTPNVDCVDSHMQLAWKQTFCTVWTRLHADCAYLLTWPQVGSQMFVLWSGSILMGPPHIFRRFRIWQPSASEATLHLCRRKPRWRFHLRRGEEIIWDPKWHKWRPGDVRC